MAKKIKKQLWHVIDCISGRNWIVMAKNDKEAEKRVAKTYSPFQEEDFEFFTKSGTYNDKDVFEILLDMKVD